MTGPRARSFWCQARAEGSVGAIAVFLPEPGRPGRRGRGDERGVAASRHQRRDDRLHGHCSLAQQQRRPCRCGRGDGGGLAVAFTGSLDNASELARELGVAELGISAPGCLPRAPGAAGRRVSATRENLAARLRGVFAWRSATGRVSGALATTSAIAPSSTAATPRASTHPPKRSRSGRRGDSAGARPRGRGTDLLPNGHRRDPLRPRRA